MAEQGWELRGELIHTIYSPRGGIEGFLLNVQGVPVQFVCAENDPACTGLKDGQTVVAIGSPRPPSDKGEAEHEVYELWEIVSPASGAKPGAQISGKIVRFNYAKHGERNGVVLDSGHFVHTKPEGLRRTGWTLGQSVTVPAGDCAPLWGGQGWLVSHKPEL